MTKRAGKKKPGARGSQRHPPGKIVNGPLADRDVLPESEKTALEMRALREGWLMQAKEEGEEVARYRQALMRKIMQIGLSTDEKELAIKAFRALSMAELRQQQIEIHRTQQPGQLNVGVQVNTQQPHEVVADLIARRDVREALAE